jgi:hypothetical protein
MNDDFLTSFRKPPPRAFAAQLYQRINTPMNTQRNFVMRRFSFAAAICLALLAALAFSPDARAAFSSLIRQIGGITFLGPEETTSQIVATPREEVITPEDILSLSEARQKLPFQISLPTWAPDGFVMGSSVRISYFQNGFTPAIINWYGSDPNVGNIELMVGQPVKWLVDTDHLQEVEVNGQPAALVGGAWNEDSGQWDREADLSLTWMKGDVMYKLSSPGAAVEDLIRMAESIP